ncbi:Uncharacterised protein [Anaerobiospirillum thomasii]|uniref:Uncharacterized protein n=1 Tax=Anaerobiospirillum thomasii TaxID=179995 RepID=A0A2X0WX64_9GAMM|nr:hypothetical protein [Anaerobiospirillum thomasii]SPT67651.1 Uncharacterised protein [Anaerobiospirillum thomasii]SPT68712.1 Uncharacterised protein [Anaerobiospirillum thomasii]SPT70111.1 Uncharacterised protein [Anaerobiospirillum thomasii]SPT72415.1 Uncharacterised protein [Anaerobiospirillum thomasii]
MKTLITFYNLIKALCLAVVAVVEIGFQLIVGALVIGFIVGIFVVILSPFIEPSTSIITISAVLVLLFTAACFKAYLFLKDDTQLKQ